MGMAASQARYLGLTARRNNNEFQAQQVTQEKTMLAMQTDNVAMNYTKGLSNRQLLFVQMDASSNSSTQKRLTYDIITNSNPFSGLNMRIVDTSGSIVVPKNQNEDIDLKEQAAIDAYTNAVNNRCFTQTETDANGSTTETILNGQNYISKYLSGTTSNPILDKDGNAINVDTFKEQVKLLDAPSFSEFWRNNEYSSPDLSVTNPNTQDRLYTEDDSAAQSAFETEMEKVDILRNTRFCADEGCKNPEYLEKKLRSGEWTLEKLNPDLGSTRGEWITATWQSEALISDGLNGEDDAAAEAEYTQKSTFYKNQDKMLELKLKQLDTEHNAIQTEMDSVKKVIEKNVESSFKIFG